MTMSNLTDEQRSTIAARAYNDCARSMQRTGVTMTHTEADELGEDALGWLSSRLGLHVEETDRGVEARTSTTGTGA
jgi:hypothetical protein